MSLKPLLSYSPTELIVARSEAFSRGDFGFIFDTYHSESNFRRQFVEREEYIAFGRSTLGQDYQISHCEVLDFREEEGEAQVIFFMEMSAQGAIQKFVELTWMRQENKIWCYHRGLKISNEDLPENPQILTFEDFAKLDQSTIF